MRIDTPERQALALRVRERVLRLAAGGGCFLGASLSCVDLVVALYAGFLRARPERPDDPERDYLLLSKGHDVPALYGTLAELGTLPEERLAAHLVPGSGVYWHPSRSVPGVEFHSGSLGHLLSVGMGIALDQRLRGGRGRVVVLAGDGELDEGSMWEGLLVASALGLTNLLLVVDRNQLQANARTEELVPLEPLADKLEAFGCAVRDVDGHDHAALASSLDAFPWGAARGARALVAHTVRGKGVPSLEGRADRWFCRFDAREVEELVSELQGNAPVSIRSEAAWVR